MPRYKQGGFLSRNPPYLFNDDGTPYDFSNDVGEGWGSLCLRTFSNIADAYSRHNIDMSEFALIQIKEKFGGLRIYLGGMVEGLYEDVDNIVTNAEEESYKICEVCGKPGKLYETGWMKTLCEDHAKQSGRIKEKTERD